jgi:hypothetical protein
VKPTIKSKARITDRYACKESTTNIIIFLLTLSAITPAKGVTINIGTKKIKLAIDNINALPVTSVIHTKIAKERTNDPNNEKS